MKEEIYRGLIMPAAESEDGESPEFICVTKENNGWAVWRCGFSGTRLLLWEQHNRDKAIEFAVAKKKAITMEMKTARGETE